MPRTNKSQNKYFLSQSQARLWLLYKMNPNSPYYNCQIIKKFKGELNIPALSQAVDYLISRHESLRTSFKEIDGEPVQIINKIKKNILRYVDLGSQKGKLKNKKLDKIYKQIIYRPFELEKKPPLRIMLVKIGKNEYFLVVGIHHIIFDYQSYGIFNREIALLYNGFCKNNKFEMPPLEMQLMDYIRWEKSRESQNEIKLQERYWMKKYSGELPKLDIPIDKPRPAIAANSGEVERNILNNETAKKLNSFIKNNNNTYFNLFLLAYSIFIYKLTNQKDIILSMPISCRDHPQSESLIGPLFNTLPIRIKINPNQKFVKALKDSGKIVIEAISNKHYPLEKIIEKLNPERDVSFSQFFNICCQYYDESGIKEEKLFGIRDIEQENILNSAKFDLYFYVTRKANRIILNLNYNTDIFAKKTANLWINYIRNLIMNILENPQIKIGDLELITPRQKNKLISKFKNKKNKISKTNVIHRLFEKQAKKAFDKTAIIFNGQKIAYQELNNRANQLAHYILKKTKILPETPIIILMERSVEFIISILAILKAGGCYVPINADYPKERIKYIIRNTKSPVVITKSEYAEEKISWFNKQIINFDSNDFIKYEKSDNPKIKIKPNNLAYILYTSGSTGAPKGVMVEHGNVINTLDGVYNAIPFKASKIFLCCNNLMFDFSVSEIFLPLLNGKTIILANQEQYKNPSLIISLINLYDIDVLQLTPSLLEILLDNGIKYKKLFYKIKKVLISGEELFSELATKALNAIDAEIYNLYGITETTIFSTIYKLKKNNGNLKIPIGSLIADTQAYVFDKAMHLLPPQIPGEIYISGKSVARGYLNKPKKAKKAFLNHPLFANEKIYKTGDMVKIKYDGDLEYLGRIGQQLKIRGNRVELGEIIYAINKIPQIKRAIVIAANDFNYNDKQKSNLCLIAYYNSKKEISNEKFRAFLKELLPDYMIPSYFIRINDFPLNDNGKLDKRSLPTPNKDNLADEHKYCPPSNDIEKQLALIWQEVLGIKKVGIYDNFFDLGGHSLKAIKIISLIGYKTGIELNLKDLFLNPNIRAIYDQIIKNKNKPKKVNLVKKDKRRHLSSIQKFFWATRKNKDKKYDNFFRVFLLRGILDIKILEKCLNCIIKRHESFRTIFKQVKNKPVLMVNDNIRLKIKIVEAGSLKCIARNTMIKNLIKEELEKPFSLEKDLLLRTIVIRISKNKNILIITGDHSCYDEESLNIFFKELSNLYNGCINSSKVFLPNIQMQYNEFVQWKNNSFNKSKMLKCRSYWKNKFNKPLSLLAFPGSKNLYDANDGTLALKSFEINNKVFSEIKKFCAYNEITFFNFFIVIYKLILLGITGENDVIIGTLISNRDNYKLENTIGPLFSKLDFRAAIKKGSSFLNVVNDIKISLLEDFVHKDYNYGWEIENLYNTILPNIYPNIFFQYQEKKVTLKLSDIKIKSIEIERKKTRFDLRMLIQEKANSFSVILYYKKQLFEKKIVNNFLNSFYLLTKEALKNPDIQIDVLLHKINKPYVQKADSK